MTIAMTNPVSVPGVKPSSLHHDSHRELLFSLDERGVAPARPDAIVVPHGRSAAYLKHAIAATKELNTRLIVLCSVRASATEAILAAKRAGVQMTALDFRLLPARLVPEFRMDSLLRGDRFHRATDTSSKRNLALLLALLSGWEKIVYLDDDIVLPQPDDLGRAARLLDRFPVVGLNNAGMPDNSVVCHARRDAGGTQDTFVGGGALAVGRSAFDSFFPNIYNEDWFFLLGEQGLRPTGVIGTARQEDYDPYRDTRRARSEELGDTLAEGVFGLLDAGRGLDQATEAYWRRFLKDRRRLIDETIEQVHDAIIEPGQRARMVDALKAAIGRNKLIEPALCVQYMQDWRQDRADWRRHCRLLTTKHRRAVGDFDKVLNVLGLGSLAQHSG
ncbi:hypothetical protein M8542_11250 [Amycolatopsis sp. OK19-0408]|uniref:Uncharacterized protein n=1 Tax=Amycolatopsis iheyensis TaxID=2945988 RepID=A0A9X2NA95_9PSEU|nr:hypothetical protein [Amycolatopsis iheyensis]MCR6483395.1 hypothetical protein [Amycolatopsis iheyensis]